MPTVPGTGPGGDSVDEAPEKEDADENVLKEHAAGAPNGEEEDEEVEDDEEEIVLREKHTAETPEGEFVAELW